MGRYDDENTITDPYGYVGKEFPVDKKISIENAYDIHKISLGDDLQSLSYKYYGTVEFWWAIAQANHIIDPFKDLPIGEVLNIPRRKEFE